MKDKLIKYSGIIAILFTFLMFLISIVANVLIVSNMANASEKRINNNIHVTLVSFAKDVNASFSNFQDDAIDSMGKQTQRITDMENKQMEITTREAAFENEITQTIANQSQPNTTNLTEIYARLAAMQEQINILNCTNITANMANESAPNIPIELQSWTQYQCYWELRQSFGRLLNPEWLCSAAQQLPEYAQWNILACSCAREAGINV